MISAGMRILLATGTAGGVWQYSVDLARGLAGLGIGTVLAALGAPPGEAQRAKAQAIPGLKLIDTRLAVDWLPDDPAAIMRAGDAVALLSEREGVDLVQLNIPALAAGTIFSRPVVAVQHSCAASRWEALHGTKLPADFAWRTELVRAGLHAADAVVTPSAAFAATTARLYGLPDMPIAVHHGSTPFSIPVGAPLDAVGLIQGPGEAPVLFDDVQTSGQLDEDRLARKLASRPVFVSPGLYEPSGSAVLAAAAARCALILSDIPTFRELWDGAATFVPLRDEEALVRTIGELTGDDFLRGAMGRAAQERSALYTPHAMAAQMAATYRSLLPAVARPVLAARAA